MLKLDLKEKDKLGACYRTHTGDGADDSNAVLLGVELEDDGKVEAFHHFSMKGIGSS
jgi:hypothetical protein